MTALLLLAVLVASADLPAVAPPPRPADPLPEGAVARMGGRLFRHPGYVATLAFALDDRVLVSAGNGALTVWDARTGRPVREIGTPRGQDDRAAGLTTVRSVGVRADGRTLFAYADQTVGPGGFVNRSFVWDLRRDAEARSLHVGLQPGRRLHAGPGLFAPYGSAMAEQDWDGGVWLWDGDGKPAGKLDAPAPSGGIWRAGRSAAFGPDGRTLYLGAAGGAVGVWDAAGRKFVRSLDGGKNWWSYALAVSADGRRVAVVGGRPPTVKKDGEAFRAVDPGTAAVRVWDPDAGRVLAELPWDGVEPLACHGLDVGFLPDGSLWAAAVTSRTGTDRLIRFRQWSPQTGEADRDWGVPAVGLEAGAMAVSADGRRVAVGFTSGAIRVLDAATGRDPAPGSGHGAEVADLRFTPDGSRLVTAAEDGTVRTWDAATGGPLQAVDGVGHGPRLSADGGTVYAGEAVPKPGNRPDLFLVARATGTGRERWRAAGLFAAVADPGGKTVWAGPFPPPGAAESGKEPPPAVVIDPATGRPGRPAPGGLPLAVSPDGRLTVTLAGPQVVVRDAATGAAKHAWDAADAGLLRESSEVAGAAFSADGKRLAVVIRHRRIRNREHAAVFVCEAADGNVVWGRQTAEHLGGAAFSPDGRWVAVAGPTAKLFDAEAGEERVTFDGHRGSVTALAFSADGKRLATGGSDGTAVVWELPRR